MAFAAWFCRSRKAGGRLREKKSAGRKDPLLPKVFLPAPQVVHPLAQFDAEVAGQSFAQFFERRVDLFVGERPCRIAEGQLVRHALPAGTEDFFIFEDIEQLDFFQIFQPALPDEFQNFRMGQIFPGDKRDIAGRRRELLQRLIIKRPDFALAEKTLDELGLAEFRSRHPNTLSGR